MLSSCLGKLSILPLIGGHFEFARFTLMCQKGKTILVQNSSERGQSWVPPNCVLGNALPSLSLFHQEQNVHLARGLRFGDGGMKEKAFEIRKHKTHAQYCELHLL